MLCPSLWSCLSLVSQLVSHLVWDVVSASLVLSSCLSACLSCRLACCVRLLVLSFSPGSLLLGFFLRVSALPRMLCPPCWACLSLVSGLVSHLVFQLVWDAVSAFLAIYPDFTRYCAWACLPACLRSFLLACFPCCLPPGLGCSVRLLGLSPSPACLPSCLPAGLGCRVRALGLSPNFVRFVQLFGVYGGVILVYKAICRLMLPNSLENDAENDWPIF